MEHQLNLPLGAEDTASAAGGREILAREGITVVYVTAPEAATAAVSRLAEAREPVALDSETAPLPAYAGYPSAGLDPHLSRIRLLQLYDGGSTVFVFDLFRLDPDLFVPLWSHPLVAHNAVFDLKHLLHAGARPRSLGCTLLMANALTGRRRGLAHLVETHLGWRLAKALQTSRWDAPDLSEGQITYAALDAVAVWRLFQLLRAELARRGLSRTYRLMRDAQPAVARMELNGIHFDRDAHRALSARWQRSRDGAHQMLVRLLGPAISPTSGKQLSQWLQRELTTDELHGWPRTPTGELKVDGAALARFPDHPILAPLRTFKEYNTLLSTFGGGFADHVSPATGRIHASFSLAGTSTGRMSCRDPNVQNIPREDAFRRLFGAPNGRTLVVADYSQIELRVAALVSGDHNMLAAYGRGEDLHRRTAAVIAGVPLKRVTAAQRQAAKAVNFGLLYGQGARGLAGYARQTYGVAMGETAARKAIEAFFHAYPGLRWWQEETLKEARRSGWVGTPGGRRVNVMAGSAAGRRQPSYTGALNSPIQGGAAEVMMAALARLDTALADTGARLVNVVHDEVVVESPVEAAHEVRRRVVAAMEGGLSDIFPRAETAGVVAAQVGETWADAK